jgi:hypothetical protein
MSKAAIEALSKVLADELWPMQSASIERRQA